MLLCACLHTKQHVHVEPHTHKILENIKVLKKSFLSPSCKAGSNDGRFLDLDVPENYDVYFAEFSALYIYWFLGYVADKIVI